jgi:gliding motility-associated-like protein
LLIPDGFSPNSDTINDTFEIVDLPLLFPNFKLQIYNRYGNILYVGNINTPNWDGTTTAGGITTGGNVVPTGVYFFILEFNDGVKEPLQGRLYLSR